MPPDEHVRPVQAPGGAENEPEHAEPSVRWLTGLLQAGDSLYPTGAYAHSFGLEGIVAEGAVSDAGSLRFFLFESAVPMLQRVDLPLVAHAWRAFGDLPRGGSSGAGGADAGSFPGGASRIAAGKELARSRDSGGPATGVASQARSRNRAVRSRAAPAASAESGDGNRTDWEAIGTLCALSSALRATREAREACEAVGRQRAELAARLHGHPAAREYLRRGADGGWPFSAPVSAALEGRIAGAPLSAALAAHAYSSLAALIAAAMKLLRLGQNAAQSLLTTTLASASSAITNAETLPLEEIGWFNPWLDIASARHETAPARLFIS